MKNVIAQFYIEPVKSDFRSEEEGRDVYNDLEHIRLIVPGSRDEIVRLATDEDRRSYKDEYKRFREDAAAPETGTPLSELPGISASLIKELGYFNIKTVETLANVSESSRVYSVMGVREWAAKAQAYIAKSTGNEAAAIKMAAENEAMKKQLEAMQAQIEAMKLGHEPVRGDGDPELKTIGIATAVDPDADGDGKVSPLERGMKAAREGKPRTVPVAYRGKPSGEEWELGYDDVKIGKSA